MYAAAVDKATPASLFLNKDLKDLFFFNNWLFRARDFMEIKYNYYRQSSFQPIDN